MTIETNKKRAKTDFAVVIDDQNVNKNSITVICSSMKKTTTTTRKKTKQKRVLGSLHDIFMSRQTSNQQRIKADSMFHVKFTFCYHYPSWLFVRLAHCRLQCLQCAAEDRNPRKEGEAGGGGEEREITPNSKMSIEKMSLQSDGY